MRLLHSHKPSHQQAGFAAILLTMIIMLVISLIVIGFAQIARREQRQSLDRQLSTQAFYAAESGVNDAVSYVRYYFATIGSTAKTSCDPAPAGTLYNTVNAGAPTLTAADQDLGNNASYTCLLIDPTPTDLGQSNLSTDPWIVPIQGASGFIKSLTITWTPQPPTAPALPSIGGCPSGPVPSLPQPANWTNCDFGLGRVDIAPIGGNFSRDELNKDTMTAFFVPDSSGANTYNYATNGTNTKSLDPVKCTSGVSCIVSIDNMPNSSAIYGQYYLRMSAMYRTMPNVTITATDYGGGTVQFVGAQIVVDSTGKAQDVLRRIRVHVPVLKASPDVTPPFALQSKSSICKQFFITPTTNPQPGTDAATSGDASNADCVTNGY